MYGDTRKYMTGIFSGQTPVRRTNPKMGESEYYYFKPNQNGWSSLSEVEIVDVPTKDTPNPFLQNTITQTSINTVQPTGIRSDFTGKVDNFTFTPETETQDVNIINNIQNQYDLQNYTPYEPDYSQPSHLEFDGKYINWQQNGRTVKSWEAMSGQPIAQSAQYTNISNVGPIPEGEYILPQGRGEDYSNAERMSFWHKQIQNNTPWYENPSSWGYSRIPIQPQTGTNTFGRDKMYVHGGDRLGSAGCIDLTSGNDSFYKDYQNYNGSLPLTVKYPKGW